MGRGWWAMVAWAGCAPEADVQPAAEAQEMAQELAEPEAERELERWLIRERRTSGAPCLSIASDGSSWAGQPVRSPVGDSPDFCSYRWRSGDQPPDLAALDEVAAPDPVGAPFVLADERDPGSDPVELAWSERDGPGRTHAKLHGCGACVSWDDGWLWIVLPPDLAGWALNGSYIPELYGDPDGQVFWGPVPDELVGQELYLTW